MYSRVYTQQHPGVGHQDSGQNKESMMDSSSHLQTIARVTYYIGWLFVLCGTIVHFGLGAGIFRSIDLPQRNLFEGSLIAFLISAVSALRAGAASRSN